MSFSLSIDKWAKGSTKRVQKLHKATIIELFSSVILDSPVLKGRFRGNWFISLGTPSTDTTSDTDVTGKATIRKVEDFVKKLDVLEDYHVYLANNLPYANRIEFDGWSHTKAPEGMVRINLARVAANLSKISA